MKKTYLVIGAVIILIAAMALRFGSAPKNETVTLETADVVKTDITRLVAISGEIETPVFEEIAVSGTSRVTDVFVKENQRVDAGKLLAKLDTGSLLFDLEKKKQDGEQLRDDLSEILSPSTVSGLGDLSSRMESARVSYVEGERSLSIAKSKLRKDEALYDAGAISKDAYDDSANSVKSLESQLDKLKIAYEDASNAYSDYEKTKRIDSSRKKRLIASNEADIASINKKIDETDIRAAVSGTLVDFALKKGQFPQAETVIRILDLDRFELRALVDQEDAVELRTGQSAAVRIKGIDKEYGGRIENIDRFASVDKQSGGKTPKVSVRISVSNPDSRLVVGYEADASVQTGKLEDVISIPREAVVKDDKGVSYVFAVEGGKTKKVKVATGLLGDYYVEIRSGLPEGAVIVKNPPDDLKENVYVNGAAKE